MALVTAKEIAQVIGLHKFGFLGTFIGWILLRILIFLQSIESTLRIKIKKI